LVAIDYNPQLEGYEVDITEEQLGSAPKYGTHETWDWKSRGHMVDDYYRGARSVSSR
jgi:hypothetical protein